ncbi:histidinol dehydrogenase [Occallatibacter riparius]|uniref:Histidinol dehydrogenase n=1 Tax=Occallatibacter riparius TaxID=1002689 RepID=A0A9J7BW29_9BACT|nr:histidinol dehydrogenase [Occallatibacter riparius]UWZ85094.1 histidinol dehydrogenase [Occallatibacter riparius]
MKLIRTFGRSRQSAAELIATLEVRGGAALDTVMPAVSRIVSSVRNQGDRALLRYGREFDGLPGAESLRVTREEMAEAWERIEPALRTALSTAAEQIRSFAEKQMPQSWTETSADGLTRGQVVRPIGAVGCYVPSGRHPLPSTLLMTAIPAQVAGVPRVVAISPRPAVEALAAAHLLGISEFYRIGGAHGIAALAYGTASIPRVEKIVGPGNLYVTAAKRTVAFDCAIDMLAGPTEIVVTSEKGRPAEIASDLVAQAEHDPEALAIFITSREELARTVMTEVKDRARSNPVAKESLQRNGVVLLTATPAEARDLTNRIAPEHLTVDSFADLSWVQSAGSVFVGRWSAQPMGDYISGPNHTLPTGGMARVRGGLSVNDFVKLITVQEYTSASMRELGPEAFLLARAEGLVGHAEAILVRLSKPRKSRSSNG